MNGLCISKTVFSYSTMNSSCVRKINEKNSKSSLTTKPTNKSILVCLSQCKPFNHFCIRLTCSVRYLDRKRQVTKSKMPSPFAIRTKKTDFSLPNIVHSNSSLLWTFSFFLSLTFTEIKQKCLQAKMQKYRLCSGPQFFIIVRLTYQKWSNDLFGE